MSGSVVRCPRRQTEVKEVSVCFWVTVAGDQELRDLVLLA